VIFGKRTKPSPARAALIATDRELKKSHQRVKNASERIERLQRVIAAEGEAQRLLRKAIVDDGGAALEAFAAGTATAAPIAEHENAVKAAAFARGALPDAQAELAEAEADVSRLELERQKRAAGVLAEHADAIARDYKAKFLELAALHDELAGIASAMILFSGADITMVREPLQVPRFNLPSLYWGSAYSPYMVRRSDEKAVNLAATKWARLGRELLANPGAKNLELAVREVDAPEPSNPTAISNGTPAVVTG
jgi:hypothetical protein